MPTSCHITPLVYSYINYGNALDNTSRHVIAVFVVSSAFSELPLRRDKPAGGEDATSLSITVSERMPVNFDLRPAYTRRQAFGCMTVILPV